MASTKIFINVDLPAPLGPNKPYIPSVNLHENLFSAFLSPYFFERLFISKIVYPFSIKFFF